MTGPLHTYYRPADWDEVIGQKLAVKSLSSMIAKRQTHCILLVGPSGVGKTTIARIAASHFGCSANEIRTIDGATYTGIDKMREVQDSLRFAPMGKSKGRAIIVDEAHRLSPNAWDSLLIATEEPPEHVIWFFCTTNVAKVPKTMRTRATTFELKPLRDADLTSILDGVCKEEKIKLPSDIIDLIVSEAQGSARQVLQNLSVCRDAKTKKEAANLLKVVLETDSVIELCRFLAQRQSGTWAKAMGIVERLIDENPEGIRIIVSNYMGSACRKSKDDRDAIFFLQGMEAFSVPYDPSEKLTPLLRSIGQVLFAE